MAINLKRKPGIFLGFPLKDVLAFIEHKGAGSILCKYWKVYHDPEKALLIFENYDLARRIVIQSIAKLYSIIANDKLTLP